MRLVDVDKMTGEVLRALRASLAVYGPAAVAAIEQEPCKTSLDAYVQATRTLNHAGQSFDGTEESAAAIERAAGAYRVALPALVESVRAIALRMADSTRSQ